MIYTMITGACGYLGGSFVKICTSNGDNLVLTGRSTEKLEKLKEELFASDYKGSILTFAADLTKENDRKALEEKIKLENVEIGRLINVAGADIQKSFEKYTEEKIVFQCRLDFEAAVSLCHIAIKNKAEKLEIINISSISGVSPMPHFAIYSALKGALTSFSISLREEMKGKNVKVTAILPGAMPTRPDVREQIVGQGLWGKMAVKSTDFVAKKSLKAVKKNKRKYIPGFWNRAINAFMKIIPLSLKLKFIANRWSKIEKDAF